MLSFPQWLKLAEMSKQIVGIYLKTKGDLNKVADLASHMSPWKKRMQPAISY